MVRARNKRKYRVQHRSLAVERPHLAKEWHPKKNGSLTPADVSTMSGKIVWWKCRKGHEWEAIVADRSQGNGCPYCPTGKRKKSKGRPQTSSYKERVKLIDAWNKGIKEGEQVTAEKLLELAGLSSEADRLDRVAKFYLRSFDMENVAEKVDMNTYRKLNGTGIKPRRLDGDHRKPRTPFCEDYTQER